MSGHETHLETFTTSADLTGCRLVCTSVFVSERPVKRSNVNTASSLAHQIEPGLEDGGVGAAGIELQPFRDALYQNDPDRGKRGKKNLYFNSLVTEVSLIYEDDEFTAVPANFLYIYIYKM